VRYAENRTVLEYAREKLDLGYAEVAQIGSWDGFKYAAASRDGAFLMNGGREALPAELSTPDIDRYVDLRRVIQQLLEESSNDVLSFRIAKEYLLKNKPRLLWIGLGQSDDWAHARRYDLVLDYLHYADTMLADLWNTLQATEPYRGRTTLIVTTDHGRGRTPADWAEHDYGIQGCQDIFIAVIGPGHAGHGRGAERPRSAPGRRRGDHPAAARPRLAPVPPGRASAATARPDCALKRAPATSSRASGARARPRRAAACP